jgi:hypothetical protein
MRHVRQINHHAQTIHFVNILFSKWSKTFVLATSSDCASRGSEDVVTVVGCCDIPGSQIVELSERCKRITNLMATFNTNEASNLAIGKCLARAGGIGAVLKKIGVLLDKTFRNVYLLESVTECPLRKYV